MADTSRGVPRATPDWLRAASTAGIAVRGALASEIIPGALWLGRGQFALETELMARVNISHVLTVASDTPEVRAAMNKRIREGTLRGYLCVEIDDFGADDGISRVFEETFAFIDSAFREGGVVFVHCANGSNRSPTLVIAYLKYCNPGWTMIQVLEHILLRRPHIMPLKDNLAQLTQWSGEELDYETFQSMKKATLKLWKRVNQL